MTRDGRRQLRTETTGAPRFSLGLLSLGACLGMTLGVALAASDAAAADEVATADIETRPSRDGLAGIERLLAPKGLPVGDMVLALTGEYMQATGLPVSDHRHQRLTARAALALSPLAGLDLALGWFGSADKHSPGFPEPVVGLGSPSLLIKVGRDFAKELGLGLAAQLMVPTAGSGMRLAPEAFVLTATALASLQLTKAVTLAANAGYRLDNSRKVLAVDPDPTRDTILRFDTDVAKSNAAVVGLGIEGALSLSERLHLAPLLEASAAIHQGNALKDNPLRLTAGAKLLASLNNPLEIVVGADWRLSGAPGVNNRAAGIPPWQLFARLAAHLGQGPKPAAVACAGPRACVASADCQANETCGEGVCLRVKEVAREVVKEVVREIAKPTPTFTLSGQVANALNKTPISGATIKFSGFESTALGTNQKGEFEGWPMPVDEALLQVTVTAPGFQALQQTLSKGTPGQVVRLALAMQPVDANMPAELRGLVQDENSGRPLAALILIPTLGKKIRVDAQGTFAEKIPAGRYNVLVSAAGYASQGNPVNVRPGEVVILNIDLKPKRR
jgi:hypothetical protein